MLDRWKIYFELNDPERNFYILNIGDANVFPSVTSSDGLYKAFAIEDDDSRRYHLFLWDIQAGNVTELVPRHTGAVDDLLFSHDGTKLVSASEDRSIAVWNLRTRERLHTLWGSADGSNDFAFNSDDSLVASVNDSRLYLWDVASGDKLYSRYAYYEHMSESFLSGDVQFSPDGSRVMFHDYVMDEISFNGNSTVIFDTRTGDRLYSAISSRKLMYTSPDGNYLLWVENTGWQIITVEILPTEETFTLDEIACSNLTGYADEPVWHIVFSPDSKLVAISPLKTCTWEDITLENMVILFDLTTGQRLHILMGHNEPVYNITFSPDGEKLLSQSKDGEIRVWDADKGSVLEIYP